jgi:hypothetical protein
MAGQSLEVSGADERPELALVPSGPVDDTPADPAEAYIAELLAVAPPLPSIVARLLRDS